MKKKWIGLLLVVGLLLLGGSFIVASQGFTTYTYEGKEIFQTAQEYESFKVAVGVSEVTLLETFVLSSEPPIVVDYTVEAPRGLDFPYGDESILPSSLLFSFLLAFGVAGTFGAGLITAAKVFNWNQV